VITPWVFEFFPAPFELAECLDPQRSAKHFNAFLDLWALAEPLGFEGLFLSEHHFGVAYSPSPNLLIAHMALRTKRLRLGVMGMVIPYHQPWRIVEEIGILDHLTGGRLEIGTAAGIPNEMELVGLDVNEARARNDEALEILDAALSEPIITHHGRFWNFENLRLVPRPLQQPSPPVWVTVVSTASARKAARRGAKICTGFHPNKKVKEIYDAYRDEAAKVGRPAGPEQLALRRQVAIATTEEAASRAISVRRAQLRTILQDDPRVVVQGRQALDTPSAHAFSVGEDEFIAGTPAQVTQQIVDQCCELGAGHFLPILGAELNSLRDTWELFGRDVIPALRSTSI
jgi:alkanesulfonate monooxygenase SsuD/methylene tetrahydromethanopterin reductase-like flavin-dependent oxidoreductase (luciferase family)